MICYPCLVAFLNQIKSVSARPDGLNCQPSGHLKLGLPCLAGPAQGLPQHGRLRGLASGREPQDGVGRVSFGRVFKAFSSSPVRMFGVVWRCLAWSGFCGGLHP